MEDTLWKAKVAFQTKFHCFAGMGANTRQSCETQWSQSIGLSAAMEKNCSFVFVHAKSSLATHVPWSASPCCKDSTALWLSMVHASMCQVAFPLQNLQQCCYSIIMKNLQPQTGPGQSSFFSFFIILVIIAFIMFSSFILSSSFFLSFQVLIFFYFLNHFFIIFHFFKYCFSFFSFFIIFASSGAKIFQKMKNGNFLVFFHFLIIFLSLFFLIIFASSGAIICQKMENCNFPRFFIF